MYTVEDNKYDDKKTPNNFYLQEQDVALMAMIVLLFFKNVILHAALSLQRVSFYDSISEGQDICKLVTQSNLSGLQIH